MGISFYEVVFISDTDTMREIGVAGSIGVVVGMPPHLLQIEDQPQLQGMEGQFAIDVQGTVYAVEAADLIPTGQVLSRDQFISGEKLEVLPERYEIDEEPESNG